MVYSVCVILLAFLSLYYTFSLYLLLSVVERTGGTVSHCLTCLVGIEVTQLATVSWIPHHIFLFTFKIL
jgi:hypothetical protein